MRVLVFGSRGYSDKASVWGELRRIATALFNANEFARLTVVHGACPSGPDAFADEWAMREIAGASEPQVQVERWHAKWDLHGRKAGPIRNKAMAQSGASLAVCGWDGQSSGTLDMLRNCIEYRIPVRMVTPEKRREVTEMDLFAAKMRAEMATKAGAR